LTRLGRAEEARTELAEAIDRCGNAQERWLLKRKRDALG
jgi:predicted RNA polymerase sigma factor